ncbi:MAG TPA: SLC13 family permease, partial [Solirubrobacter sp.]
MILAAVLLAAAIAAAIVRDRRAPEAAVALGGAALLLVVGVLSWDDARDEFRDLAPTLVVLASLLVLGEGCERAGVFDALAARLAAGARGSAPRLLTLVVGAAAAVTAVLGLDATVVLLTPAAFAAAAKARLNARPHVYACAHLANSASLLLPISNLTNLLAFRASDLSFARFAALMALPWAVAIAIEWGALRFVFRRDLESPGRVPRDPPPPLAPAPLAVLAVTLVGFVVAGPLHLDAAWPAAL